MNLDEYNAFINSFVDQNEYPIRDNPYYFNISLQLQINEINSERHLNMYFPEFHDAMCRAIDRASPVPQRDSSNNEWSYIKRTEQPLISKLENIIPILIRRITHPDYAVMKTKFVLPKKDPSTELYILDCEANPFYASYPVLLHTSTY